MMLFKITFAHYSQKDREEGIKGYIIAETEREAMEYIDASYAYDSWKESDPVEVWDEKLEKLIERPYLDKIMKERGEFWEGVSDLYYGATQHGWDEGVEISDEDAEVLVRLGIAERPEKPKERET